MSYAPNIDRAAIGIRPINGHLRHDLRPPQRGGDDRHRSRGRSCADDPGQCGSIRWCTSTPPRRQRRRTVLLVATPPSGDRDGRRARCRRDRGRRPRPATGPRSPARVRQHGRRRRAPLCTDSAPAFEQTPQATMSPARPLPMPPGSNRVPDRQTHPGDLRERARSERRRRRTAHRAWPLSVTERRPTVRS